MLSVQVDNPIPKANKGAAKNTHIRAKSNPVTKTPNLLIPIIPAPEIGTYCSVFQPCYIMPALGALHNPFRPWLPLQLRLCPSQGPLLISHNAKPQLIAMTPSCL